MKLRFDLILITILTLVLAACAHDGKPRINKVEAKFVSREGAKVYFSYPQIASGVDDSIKTKLNTWMKNMSELREKKVADADFSIEEADISYNFSVLLLNDSILSIENKKVYKGSSGKSSAIVYRPIVFNHQNGSGYITPESLLPGLKRSDLAPHIEKSMESFQSKPNMNAYEDGASYLISFAVTKDSLILYPGDEGEFFGYDRFPIALSELSLEVK